MAKVTRSKTFRMIGKTLSQGHMYTEYESSTFNGSKVIAKVKVFRNVG